MEDHPTSHNGEERSENFFIREVYCTLHILDPFQKSYIPQERELSFRLSFLCKTPLAGVNMQFIIFDNFHRGGSSHTPLPRNRQIY